MAANKDILINVCMGTGGIAAGGSEVMDSFREEFEKAGLEARVEKTVNDFLKKANVVTSDELKAVKKEIRELKKMISSENEKS